MSKSVCHSRPDPRGTLSAGTWPPLEKMLESPWAKAAQPQGLSGGTSGHLAQVIFCDLTRTRPSSSEHGARGNLSSTHGFIEGRCKSEARSPAHQGRDNDPGVPKWDFNALWHGGFAQHQSLTHTCTWQGSPSPRSDLVMLQLQIPPWQLLSRDSSKKARSGCHIYGIKQLARSQITSDEKGCETPCTHQLLCSLTKLALREPPAIHVLIAWSLLPLPAHTHQSRPCHPVPVGVFKEHRETREVHDLPTAQTFISSNHPRFGQAVECVHHRAPGRHGTTNHHKITTKSPLFYPRSVEIQPFPGETRSHRPRMIAAALPRLFAVGCGRFSAGNVDYSHRRASPARDARGWQLGWAFLGAPCTHRELQLTPTGHSAAQNKPRKGSGELSVGRKVPDTSLWQMLMLHLCCRKSLWLSWG